MELINIIIALISGVVGAGFTFFLTLKKDKRDDYTTIINAYRTEFDRQLDRITDLETHEKNSEIKINSLTTELAQLKLLTEKYRILEPAHQTLPIPFWIKDNEGTVLYINEAYVNDYLVPNNKSASDYLGKTDIEFWDADAAKLYADNDIKGKKSMKVFQEYVVVKGIKLDITVIKYPIKLGNIIIGVGGISIGSQILNFNKNGKS